ncbi:MAG: hypothetical protein QNJ97_14880 [Myxococcota bacterium]|nr:hypothetical protein [Myxococcota bacterium]
MTLWKLDVDARLFEALSADSPRWWQNLLREEDIWADVRKGNKINIYYRCGSIMNLSYGTGFNAEIHFEYIPLQESRTHIKYRFDGPGLELDTAHIEIPTLNAFDADAIKRVKKRIGKFNPTGSEKAIQADFVIKNNGFIDTEFAHGKARIDLAWLDAPSERIVFIELKTVGDDRLYFGEDTSSDNENIAAQLRKYHEFLTAHESELGDYYRRLFAIKKRLGILPSGCEVDSLDGFKVETHPILLVGDCMQLWIDKNAVEINERIRDCALGAFYHGKTTRTFHIPSRSTGNKYVFREG